MVKLLVWALHLREPQICANKIATVFLIWVPFYGYTIKNHLLKKIFLPRAHPEPSCSLCSCFHSAMPCSVGTHAISPAFGPGLQRRTAYRPTLPASKSTPWPWPWGPWGPRAIMCSACDSIIPPMEKALVKMDIQMALPSGCYGWVVPHSSSATKHLIDIEVGITDEDYRGNVHIVVFHFDKEKLEVKKMTEVHRSFVNELFFNLERVSSSFKWH